MAIPAVGSDRRVIVAFVTEVSLVGVAVQTCVGKAHVELFAFRVDKYPFRIADNIMTPEV